MNVFRENWSFAERKLRGRRAGLASDTIGDCSAIAQGPHARMILHRKCGLDDHGAALISFDRERAEKRIRRSAGCPDQRFCRNFAVTQRNDSGLEILQAGVQAEDNSAVGHFLLRVTPQGFAQLGKNMLSRVDQNDVQVLGPEVRIIGQNAAAEVIERASQLHAGEASAGDHERQQPLPQLGVGLASARSNISITRLRTRMASSRLLKSSAYFWTFAMPR